MVPGLLRLRDRFDAVLLDLDGTLLPRAGHIRPRTIRAVRALAHHGFEVVICTGRSVAGTVPTYEALDLGGAIVSYNGHWIGVPGDEPWHILRIPDDTIDCVARVETHAEFVFRHHDELKYTLRTDHPEHVDVLSWYENTIVLDEIEALPSAELMRVSMFFADAARIDRAWASMTASAQATLHREVFPLSLFPNYGGSDLMLLELQGKSRGKAEAFAWLQAEHGIPPSRTIAIGDHLNDWSMLETAGFAVVPDNADSRVRPLADLVIGHHDDDGIAAWIEAGAPLDGKGFPAP